MSEKRLVTGQIELAAVTVEETMSTVIFVCQLCKTTLNKDLCTHKYAPGRFI